MRHVHLTASLTTIHCIAFKIDIGSWDCLAASTNTAGIIGPILWGHSGPLCHALSLSWTSMRRRRATVTTPREWQCKIRRRAAARSGEWSQHFSNASCELSSLTRYAGRVHNGKRTASVWCPSVCLLHLVFLLSYFNAVAVVATAAASLQCRSRA